jgi:hypothetical protein
VNPEVQALAEALRAAQEAHHEAEQYLPEHDWATWYAAYVLHHQANGPKTIDAAAQFADGYVKTELGEWV